MPPHMRGLCLYTKLKGYKALNFIDNLNMQNIPRHIAIIMDGNGRWAESKGLPRTFGHKEGAKTLKKIVRLANNIGVKAITVYAFSTENWKRPELEVNFLMNLLDSYLKKEINELNKENVKVIFSGKLEKLPTKVRERAEKTIDITKDNTGLVLNLAVNYGGQAEIINAVNNILKDVKNGKIENNQIDETIFKNYLYTVNLPDVDLLIRPGGDMRISNFLLWQIAYAEIWFTDTFWPDIKEEDFCKAIQDYQTRDRRFGALNKK